MLFKERLRKKCVEEKIVGNMRCRKKCENVNKLKDKNRKIRRKNVNSIL